MTRQTALPARPALRRSRFSALRCATATFALAIAVTVAVAETPAKGATAPDFTLSTPTRIPINLKKETAKGTTVLVVLRGYPGYQCPYCTKQVHDFVDHSADFAARHAHVLFVYPGPPAGLDQHSKEFLAKQANLPPDITLVTDPDYKVTNQYGLRWDAPHETAYPSTFILGTDGKIAFEQISREHGGRTTAADVLSHIAAN